MNIPAEFFDLPDDVAHVLCLNVTEHMAWLETGLGVLNMAERAHAMRYTNPWYGRRYAYTRALLRMILGRFLACSPYDIEFSYGPYGKPRLNGAWELGFNLSHSGDWVAFGFSLRRRIGIDLENVADCHDCLAVAHQCFSPRELTVLKRETNTAQAFCSIWVRKEAVLKAAGMGLDSMQALCALDPMVSLRDERGNPSLWFLSEVPMQADCALALATEGSPIRNVLFRL